MHIYPFSCLKVLFLLSTLTISSLSTTTAQTDHLLYYQLINEMDSVLQEKDTVSALLLYEKMVVTVDEIPAWNRHRKASQLYMAMEQKD